MRKNKTADAVPETAEQQARIAELTAAFKRKTVMTVLGVLTVAALITALIAAVTGASAGNTALIVLFFAGLLLPVVLFILKSRINKQLAEEMLLHEAAGTDTEENCAAFRNAVNARRLSGIVTLAGLLLWVLLVILYSPAFLLLPLFLIGQFLVRARLRQRYPFPAVPAAEVSRRLDARSSVFTLISAGAVAMSGCLLLAFAAYGSLAGARLRALDSTAHTVFKAVQSWQEECEQQGIPAVLPPVSEEQRGTDPDPDSLSRQIYPLFTDIEKVPYYRIQSDADGKVTGVLVSQSPIGQTWRPKASEQRQLLSGFFTAKKAIGYYSIVPDISYE